MDILGFDPTKIFKRMWSMRRRERVLVVATIVLTALALLCLLPWISSTIPKVVIFLLSAAAVSMWVILILYDLVTTSGLKKNLDKLISQGERIKSRLTGYTEDDIDKYEQRLYEWDESVEKVLKGTDYEHSWRSNVGLTNPEDESQSAGLEELLVVQRNYIYKRLTRLKDIKDSL